MNPDHTISEFLNGDLDIKAIFYPVTEEKRPKITISSFCNCLLENTTNRANFLTLSRPIDSSLGTNIEVIYSSITLKVKSDKVFLTAPEITSLTLCRWNNI